MTWRLLGLWLGFFVLLGIPTAASAQPPTTEPVPVQERIQILDIDQVTVW